MLREDKLDFWIKNRLNVLFIGKHGVGKTAMVKEAFNRANLEWRYFSASTMDPWVDFIGVPKERQEKMAESFEVIKQLATFDPALAVQWVVANWKMDEDAAKRILGHIEKVGNGVTYLDLVRPQSFAEDKVEALFFDEFNRSPKKVRNAVMELLQFKSINGTKFDNLKIIWAAINPDDDEDETYDVERLDPAQADRFHINIEIPYKPNGEWFKSRFGDRIAKAAVQWWEELPDEEKLRVSPRRLEYALNLYELKGDMRDVLPITSNVSKLTTALNTGPITEKLETLMRSKDTAEARTFLSNENNYASAMKYILESDTLMAYFLPLLSKEKLASLMADQDKACKHIIGNSDRVPLFMDVCKQLLHANTNQRLVKKIRRALTENQDLATSFATGVASQPAEAHFNKAKAGKSWATALAELKKAPANSAHARQTTYEKIVASIPEKLTADEALETLELLNKLFGQQQGVWASMLNSKPMEKFMGVVNHCIGEIHRNTGYDWTTILNHHGTRFKGLLEKIKLGGMSGKLLCPTGR